MEGRASWAALVLAFGLSCLALPTLAQSSGERRSEWISPLDREHALVGTIWSTQGWGPVSEAELVGSLAKSTIVLLGEVHDNADHHRLRASVVGALAGRSQDAGGAVPAIVFEHIRANQQGTVDSFLASADRVGERNSAHLLQQLEWERSGWPSGAMFAPLFDVALRFRLPIIGGNTPADTIRKVGRQGPSVLPEEERERLRLDVQLEASLQNSLLAEIEGSHCGLLPASAFPPMALAQRYRDAHLADVLLSARERYGSAVLIAGNGHVRSDRGVPWHVRLREPDLAAVVVAFAEVEDGKLDFESYVPRYPEGRPAVDYVWFTPRAERTDPCLAMRQHLERGKRKQGR